MCVQTGGGRSGAEADDWVWVRRAVPADSLDQEWEELVAPVRTKSRPGLGWVKSVTRRGSDLSLADGIALESSSFVQYSTTHSHPKEGIKAFKEKRQPEF